MAAAANVSPAGARLLAALALDGGFFFSSPAGLKFRVEQNEVDAGAWPLSAPLYRLDLFLMSDADADEPIATVHTGDTLAGLFDVCSTAHGLVLCTACFARVADSSVGECSSCLLARVEKEGAMMRRLRGLMQLKAAALSVH